VYEYWYYYAYDNWHTNAFDLNIPLNSHEHDFEAAFVWVNTTTGKPFYYALTRHQWINRYDVSDVSDLRAYVELGGHGMVKNLDNDVDWLPITWQGEGLNIPGNDFTFISMEVLKPSAGVDLNSDGKYKSDEPVSTCVQQGQIVRCPVEDVIAPWKRPDYQDPEQQIRQRKGPKGGPFAIISHVLSPVELRVYDSQGRVTGIVNGEVKNEIPNSSYYEETVRILYPTDTYTYELVGTSDGSYGFDVINISDQGPTSFSCSDFSITDNAIHEYLIDWDDIAQGGNGVTLQIDSDGDGYFEQTQHLSATGDSVAANEGLPIWLWIMVGGIVVVVLAGFVIYRNQGRLARETADISQFKSRSASKDIYSDTRSSLDVRCPICGSRTSIRVSKKGPNAGRKFYVCSRYPECNGKIPIKSLKHSISSDSKDDWQDW